VSQTNYNIIKHDVCSGIKKAMSKACLKTSYRMQVKTTMITINGKFVLIGIVPKHFTNIMQNSERREWLANWLFKCKLCCLLIDTEKYCFYSHKYRSNITRLATCNNYSMYFINVDIFYIGCFCSSRFFKCSQILNISNKQLTVDLMIIIWVLIKLDICIMYNDIV